MRTRILVALTAMAAPLAAASADAPLPASVAADLAHVRQLADTYYPAITRAAERPEGLVLGFLLGPDGAPLRHSVAVGWPDGTSTTDELRRMFPSEPVRTASGGGGCFGGRGKNVPRYCTAWAERGA